MQLPHFHFLPVAAAAASDAPQGSWLEGGRSGGSGGEETTGIFRDQADSAVPHRDGSLSLEGEHGKS